MKQQASKKRKVFLSVAIVTLVAGLGIFTTYAAFSATTDNTGNRLQAGSVDLNDTDGGTGKLSLISGGTGNQSQQKCIRITYSGSLAATIKLYRSAIAAAANGRYRLHVERGTKTTAPDSTMACGDFSATADVFASADLDTLGTTYDTGSVDIKGSSFSTGNFVDLRFTTTVKDGTLNGNKTDNDTNTFDYVFEARG
jgi:hypothetical protein